MPEDRLYFEQSNKAKKVSAERISRMSFVSSLNSVSSRRVQHISYICVFLTHTTHFLPRGKAKTCLVRKDLRLYFYRCFLSRGSAHYIYAVSDTQSLILYIYMLIMEE